MELVKTEKATYDPDLPHDFMRGWEDDNSCELCSRPRKDELHQVQTTPQRASEELLQRELGS